MSCGYHFGKVADLTTMQVVDDKIKDAKPLSAFIRGESVVGTVAISASGASGVPDWSN